jgi:hypothetical protein
LDNLLEVYIAYEITGDQARAKYGYKTDKDLVKYVEHWTLTSYETKLDDIRVDRYSGVNPWRLIPFEFVPRYRSTHWWGDSLTEDLIRIQDELNMRIADVGEAINYNSHPTRWGYNMPKSFNSKNYPLGPNIFWDLGRRIGQSEPPTVGMLEAKNPVPKEAMQHVQFLYDYGRVSAFAPPIVFGEDDGGGQRSGITLEIRMWPLIKAVRRSRSYMGGSLIRGMQKSAKILQQKDFSDVPKRALQAIIEGRVIPHFAPVMPRDQAAIVDEVVKLGSMEVPHISLETGVKKLGYGTYETQRIQDQLDDDGLYKRQNQAAKTPGVNSGAGNAPKK